MARFELLLMGIAALVLRNLSWLPSKTCTCSTEPEVLLVPPHPHRKILFVHVGKAGGVSLRKALRSWNQRLPKVTVLPRYFHLWVQPYLEDATTYVVSLRNPVDRIISAYRYSHVQNCQPIFQTMRAVDDKPYGCHLLGNHSSKNPEAIWWVQNLWRDCFPSAAMEDFAQSVLSPWNTTTTTNNRKTPTGTTHCHKLARIMVEGRKPGARGGQLGSPHMFYNYEYYATHSIRAHPGKEVWAIRTEYQEQDLRNLEYAIKRVGGTKKKTTTTTTTLPTETNQAIVLNITTHGSEHYLPSPLSKEAYQKLCCVLEREILVYEEFLNLSSNLQEEDREESMGKVKAKCGVVGSWEEWRRTCRRRLLQDWQVLRKHQMP